MDRNELTGHLRAAKRSYSAKINNTALFCSVLVVALFAGVIAVAITYDYTAQSLVGVLTIVALLVGLIFFSIYYRLSVEREFISHLEMQLHESISEEGT